MSSDRGIDFSVENHVAVVRLNRPRVFNAVNRAMRERLLEIFLQADASPDIRALVLLGEGKAFCAGQDLKEGGGERTAAEMVQEQGSADFQDALARMKKPTLAGLHGYTLGRGLLLALACDIRIAADDTLCALPETQLGMLPGGGGTQRLPRIVGMGRALHLILTGNRIDAETALSWGLVSQVVHPDELEPAALALTRRIADNAPLALQFAKRAVYAAADTALEDGMNLEANFQAVLRTTEDWKEGGRAFKERRRPEFRGQ